MYLVSTESEATDRVAAEISKNLEVANEFLADLSKRELIGEDSAAIGDQIKRLQR